MDPLISGFYSEVLFYCSSSYGLAVSSDFFSSSGFFFFPFMTLAY